MNIPGAMLRSVFSTKKYYDPHSFQPIKLEEGDEDYPNDGNLGFKPCRCCLELDVSTSPFDACVGCLMEMRQALAADGCSFTEINRRINGLLAGPGWKRFRMLDRNASKVTSGEEEMKGEKRRGGVATTLKERLEKQRYEEGRSLILRTIYRFYGILSRDHRILITLRSCLPARERRRDPSCLELWTS